MYTERCYAIAIGKEVQLLRDSCCISIWIEQDKTS